MDWASQCKKTAMWPGWADSKCLRSCVLGDAEKPLARASPGRIQAAAPLLWSPLLIGGLVLRKAE